MSPRLVRTSERTQFKRCRQSWQWAYVDRIKPRQEATPLRFGTLIHKALELRYPPGVKRGPHPARTFAKLYKEATADNPMLGRKDEDGDRVDMGDLGVAMMNGFVEEYGRDEAWEVIASEMTFQVPVRTTLKSGPTMEFHYVGTLDGVWRNRASGQIIFIDWKTAASISLGHLPLDEQSGAYWTYAPEHCWRHGILPAGTYPSHILFTFMRKSMPDGRERNAQGHYLNKDGTVSKKQPGPLFHREVVYRDEADRESVRRRVRAEVREMAMVRRGDLAVYKNPGPFTCMGCGYRDMCELHETGADYEMFRDATMAPWDPYAAHEIESEGK